MIWIKVHVLATTIMDGDGPTGLNCPEKGAGNVPRCP